MNEQFSILIVKHDKKDFTKEKIRNQDIVIIYATATPQDIDTFETISNNATYFITLIYFIFDQAELIENLFFGTNWFLT